MTNVEYAPVIHRAPQPRRQDHHQLASAERADVPLVPLITNPIIDARMPRPTGPRPLPGPSSPPNPNVPDEVPPPGQRRPLPLGK